MSDDFRDGESGKAFYAPPLYLDFLPDGIIVGFEREYYARKGRSLEEVPSGLDRREFPPTPQGKVQAALDYWRQQNLKESLGPLLGEVHPALTFEKGLGTLEMLLFSSRKRGQVWWRIQVRTNPEVSGRWFVRLDRAFKNGLGIWATPLYRIPEEVEYGREYVARARAAISRDDVARWAKAAGSPPWALRIVETWPREDLLAAAAKESYSGVQYYYVPEPNRGTDFSEGQLKCDVEVGVFMRGSLVGLIERDIINDPKN